MNLEKLESFTVYEAHRSCAAQITLEIESLGKKFTICGKETRMVQIGVPTVELLTKNSTPENMCLSGEAISYLREAVRCLIGGGVNFYTELKSGWNTPVFYWEVVTS